MNISQWFNQRGINFFITLVVLLIITSVCLTFYGKSLVKQHLKVQAQVLNVRNALQDMHTHVNNADLGLRGYIIIKDEKFLIPFHDAKENRENNLDSLAYYLTQQKFPALNDLQMVRVKLDDYFSLIEEMVNLREKDSINSILQVLSKDPGYDVWKVYSKFTEDVIKFENRIEADSQHTYEATMQGVVFVQFLLLSVGGLCGYLSFLAKKTEKARRKLFKELDEHNRNLIFDDRHPQTGQDENTIMSNLINNLQKAFVFIRSIASGNYTIEWEGLTQENREANRENLVGELIEMREQMKKVKETDERRLWATEALTKVDKIARVHQHDVTKLADEMLTHVIHCLGANQAGIFVINDDKKCLDMVSCYAYERKKYIEKKVALGEGLLGQAYLEGETIYMTEIPGDYVRITSGLGKATPRSIMIVPLRYNEEIMGVLEIAAFVPFEQYQIEFVESAGEIIAASLSTVKNSEKMRKFLEQSREQAEMLRSQEEEMRQNMEELQATQEEMTRKTKEYEAIIKEYEEKLSES